MIFQNSMEVEKHTHHRLNLEVERSEYPKEKGCRKVSKNKTSVEGIPISVAQAQVQQVVVGDLAQEYSQGQMLT